MSCPVPNAEIGTRHLLNPTPNPRPESGGDTALRSILPARDRMVTYLAGEPCFKIVSYALGWEMRTAVLSLFLTVLLALPARAQVPELINYQGRLVSGSNLVNGSVSIAIDFFTSPVSGSSLYSETQTVNVVDGLYTMSIGSAGPTGVLSQALMESPVFLQLTVDGTPLLPREQLAAAPYALFASRATEVDRGDAGDYENLLRDLDPDFETADLPFDSLELVSTNGGPASFSATFGSLTDLDVVAFVGKEDLSRLYEYRVEFLSSNIAINASSVVGESGEFRIHRGGLTELFKGAISEFRRIATTASHSRYIAVLRPALSSLTRRHGSRVYQNMTIKDVVDTVMTNASVGPVTDGLNATHPSWEYRVQYKESDLNFISRLMEEEGIYFVFTHSAGGPEVTLADDNTAGPVAANSPASYYGHNTSPATPGEEYIQTLDQALRPAIGKVTLGDYDFVIPIIFGSTAQVPDGPSEFHEFGTLASNTADSARLAALRLEQFQSDRSLMTGTANTPSFHPGAKFTLTDHTSTGFAGTYLITSVQHVGIKTAEPQDPTHYYANRFTCIPDTVPFRPARSTPKPRVQGPQTAVVVGPSGEEIYTDKYGRIKVQFHWDREGMSDENSSLWMRVSQPWAGSDWGTIFIPRIGDEVIVDFLEGDPDRPLVVGSVYNQARLPPYALPTNRTVTAIRTRSSPSGSGAFNEIRFEDKAGSEQILIHSKDLRLDAPVTVQGDFTVSSNAGPSTLVAPGERFRDNSIRAWARVDSNGSVGTDEFGVGSVIRPATGQYVVLTGRGGGVGKRACARGRGRSQCATNRYIFAAGCLGATGEHDCL
jgi:type VI secretion system VgrG family protein